MLHPRLLRSAGSVHRRKPGGPTKVFCYIQEMPSAPNRRRFLKSTLATALAAWSRNRAYAASNARTTQPEPDGFFTLGRRADHWWLITPYGKPFFTMGLNHIDPATLRYPENISIWREPVSHPMIAGYLLTGRGAASVLSHLLVTLSGSTIEDRSV